MLAHVLVAKVCQLLRDMRQPVARGRALVSNGGMIALPARPSLAAARTIARNAGHALLDFVFPPICIGCRRATAAHEALCPRCWSRMRFIEQPYCARLGTPFEQDLRQPGLVSPAAIADPPVFARARAVARFEDGPARLIVHRLKYYDRLELARPVARWMARAGAELLADARLLVPMPMHRLRLAQRRFNQAALLAQILSAETGIPAATQALIRTKPTPPQVGLSRAQRAANVQGAFRVPDERRHEIAGLRVVLVDDVMTSGASANAAARALLRAGAAAVDVLVFGRVVAGH